MAVALLRRLRRDTTLASKMARMHGGRFGVVWGQYRAIRQAAEVERRGGAADDSLKSFSFLSYNVWCWRAHELQFLIDEVFGREEYRFKATRGSPRILDCGSNIGVSVLYFKHQWPNARIEAFEPDPNCFAALKRTVEDNELKSVQIHNVAVAGDAGVMQFFTDSTRPGSLRGSISQTRAREGSSISVPAVTLSSFLCDEPADLLKLDVEGAELDVVSELSAKGALQSIDQAVIEYHHNLFADKTRLSRFLALLENAGYSYTLSATDSAERARNSFQDVVIRASRL